MNVFICWSGVRSELVARALHEWLADIIQALRPFMSSESIRKGIRWQGEIANRLAETNYGILCVTAENQSSPWMLFEAGALSKHMKDSRVTVLLIGIDTIQVDPLSQFQAVPANREQIFRLVEELNELLPPEKRVTPQRLQRALRANCRRLEKVIDRALSEDPVVQRKPSNRDKLKGPFATETELLMLKLLRDTPAGMNGLQLVEASGGRLKRGTVYVTLGRLEEKGFIDSRILRQTKHAGLPRPIYRLNAAGARALAAAELLGPNIVGIS